jgi:hypothetical protein
MSRPRSRAFLIALVATAVALLLPAGASAATVVNGDFEDGNLTGWNTYSSNGEGEWLAYAKEPGQGIFTPPSGNWAVHGEQHDPDTTILYQDVALPAGQSHQLTLRLYYESSEPIVVPVPNTLGVNDLGSMENQQLRVDVIRPTAPLESLAPDDVLATAYASKVGDPEEMAPTVVGADLSALAGQTVRLRIAMAIHQGPFDTGVDAVSIASAASPPPAPPAPSNEFSGGKVRLTPGTGGGFLPINVPGAGVINAVDARTKIATATTSLKAIHLRIRRATKNPKAAGKVLVPLHPNSYGFKKLEEKGELKVKVRVTYTPTGGLPNTKSFKVTLKLAPSGGGPSR